MQHSININMTKEGNVQGYAVAYLGGGARCDAPLWPDHENFLQATLYEKVRFCHFPARIAKFNNV